MLSLLSFHLSIDLSFKAYSCSFSVMWLITMIIHKLGDVRMDRNEQSDMKVSRVSVTTHALG